MKKMNRIISLWLLASVSFLGGFAQENQTYILHTIEKGQSLYSIASMYGVSQNEIIKLNPGSDKKIYTGHTLRIPRNREGETFHTIETGETLYGLTVKYQLTAQAICDANPGLSASNFRAGQVILIPAPKTQPASGRTDAAAEDTVGRRDRCRDIHKVKRRETVYSISREYGISEEELIAANPEIKDKNKLKRGTFLCIPYPASDNVARQSQTAPTNSELFAQKTKASKHISPIKAALILPFLSDGGTTGENARMVEYYEGLLMAVDSLKRSGVSIDLYTYNTGSDAASVSNILRQKELKDMNVIFGPLHPQQIKPLADFSEKNDIRLVIPFTSKDNTVFQNPVVYQVNTPQSYLYSEVYEHFIRQFPKVHVIFLEAGNAADDKAAFVNGLKEELRTHAIPASTLPEDATVTSMKAVLRIDRTNIFIPTSGSNTILMKVLPQLTLLTRENPDYAIQLFGYPEWQTYTKDYLETFFELDTYFYSSFYTNNLLPAARKFTQDFRKWYGKEMDDRYPKYGMLGFDTGYFFLKGLSRYGNDLEQNLQHMDLTPIQTGFKFQRVNNWGGFINKKVFFVHFTRNYELVKLDFD